MLLLYDTFTLSKHKRLSNILIKLLSLSLGHFDKLISDINLQLLTI